MYVTVTMEMNFKQSQLHMPAIHEISLATLHYCSQEYEFCDFIILGTTYI
jgi:hypothetical protein